MNHLSKDAMCPEATSMSMTAEPAAEDVFLKVDDIHAYYGQSYIVQGVSFDVAESEIVALLGRNGAGKTSTLRTIARTEVPVVFSPGFVPGEEYGDFMERGICFENAVLGLKHQRGSV